MNNQNQPNTKKNDAKTSVKAANASGASSSTSTKAPKNSSTKSK